MKTYETHELVIKNMICSRCLKVVRQDLEDLGVEVLELRLGKLKIRFSTEEMTLEKIKTELEKDDFEFATDKDEVLAEEIKLVLVEMINKIPIILNQKLSDFLAEKLHRDYWTLSKTFSKVEGITLEHYFIMLRVEKAKELIEYDEMNFSEIAYELGYGNINHLSGQFKRVTGMSMSEYKKLKNKQRTPFDKII